MPNFDLVQFVNNQVAEVDDTQVAQFMEDNKVNYVVFSALLEKVIMDSLLKYQGTAQSQDMLQDIAIGVAPLMEKIVGTRE
tara:strand:+ start:73 stop:315 length:243 start_codon:yes stop_codon:yes gene_type:complete